MKWASLTGHSSSFRLNATEADEHFRQHWLKNKLYPSFMIVKPKMLIKCGWRLGLILTSATVNVMENTPSSKTSQPGQRAADVATLLAQQKCPWGLKLSLDVTSSNEQSFWESSIEQRGLLHRSEFLSLSWKTSVHHDIENRCWFRFQIFFFVSWHNLDHLETLYTKLHRNRATYRFWSAIIIYDREYCITLTTYKL